MIIWSRHWGVPYFLRTAYQFEQIKAIFARTNGKRLFACSLSCSPIPVSHMVTLKVTHKRAFSLVTNLGNQNLLLTSLLTMPQ